MLYTLIRRRGPNGKQIYNFTLPTRIGLYKTIDYHLSLVFTYSELFK